MSPLPLTLRCLAFAALALAVPLTGCEEAKVVGLGPVDETKDANFEEGRKLAQEGKAREGLAMFTKVILSRAEAPESHMEAGLLCLDAQVKDPLLAIFHFRRYLALRPDSIHSRVAQDRIRFAEKEFLKALPSFNAEDSRVASLQGQLALVRAENDRLKLKVGAAIAPVTAPVADAPEDTASAVPPTLSPTARPEVDPVAAATRQAKSGKPAGVRRTHVIAKGDSLAAISRKYYGTSARWKDILNANSAAMKNERDLKVGREIVIPE